MSDLYATIPTSARKTVPTARGHKSTGISAEVCSWEGKIVTKIWWNEKAQDFYFSVEMDRHHGKGDSAVICSGRVGDKLSLIGAPIDEAKLLRAKMAGAAQ
jgi:hypothetical protein